MVSSVVYAIRNIRNGKMYIGSTLDFKQRKARHIQRFKKGKNTSSLQEDYDKYGKDVFTFFILEELIDGIDNFLEREDFYVLKFNTLAPDGYNIHLPSKRDISSIKRRNLNKEYYNNHAPNSLKRMSPEEWLKKRKENSNFSIRTHRTTDKELDVALYLIDKESFRIIKEYSKISHFAKETNCNTTHLEKVLKHNESKPYNLRTVYGKCVIRKRDYILPLISPKPVKEKIIKEKKPLLGVTLINNSSGEIREFSNRKEAALYIGASYNNLMALIKGIKYKGNGKIVNFNSLKGWSIKK